VLNGEPLDLYRITKRAKSTLTDFYSGKQLGEIPFGKELRAPELHESVSMWDTANGARNFAINRPALGSHIARLRVTPDAQRQDVQIHPTIGEPGHYDVWSEPHILLSLVKKRYPVRT
jgi:hypothetical protein